MANFIVTAVDAAILAAMAVAFLTAKRKSVLHRYFSLFLIMVSLWLLSGFVDRLSAAPSEFLVTMQYRFAYAVAVWAVAFFFLFGLEFLKGGHGAGLLDQMIMAAAFLLSLSCFTDLIIRRAEYANGSYLVSNGNLYPLFITYFAALGGGGLLCIAIKWRHSRSLDRWRAFYILLGFGIFFFLAFLLTIILPGIMDRDYTSDYTFMAAIIPAGFTAYAILRYQLLDVRIALRRLLAYLLSVALFGIPLVAFYALLHTFWKPHPNLERGITILILALAVGLAPMARDLFYRLASRLLFTGLYDEVELQHQVSGLFQTPDIREGIGRATHMVCDKLGLSEVTVVIPREIFSGQADWVTGTRRIGGELREFHQLSYSGSSLHRLTPGPVILENVAATADVPAPDPRLTEEMKKNGVVACLPIRGSLGQVGVLLVGHKVRSASLDPIDLSFLGQFGDRAGIFIENYLLSAYLMTQLEEARRMHRKVEELDRFKTDIINVTSHEFHTPITILNGYAVLLRDRFFDFDDEKRRECLQNIIDSCHRLTSLLDQFITISRFQSKETPVFRQVFPVDRVFEELRAELEPEQMLRLKSQVEGEGLCVSTDRSYLTILLRNIVNNALRFSPPDSPVILRAEAEGEQVRISVRDYGVGMAPNEVRNIFEPFDRLEDADKHHSGTGLGLYIVRLIAELLETEIEVETEPGGGTEFSFRLPLCKETF